MTPEQLTYRKKRIDNWDRIARKTRQRRTGAFYHALLRRYYQFMVPPGQKVLELGCGSGDLLAALSPASGVGLDFSREMVRSARRKYPDLHFICADAHDIPLKKQFDVVILSDLINDLWDIQTVLESLHPLCHSGTRIIINFFNNMWRLPILMAKRLHLTVPLLEQNWLAPADVRNLLYLSDWESIKLIPRILLPVNGGIVSTFANRLLVNIRPFSWLALTSFVVARPAPRSPAGKQSGMTPTVSLIIPARNEAGTIESLLHQASFFDNRTELIFVEGHSRDNTYDVIARSLRRFPDKPYQLIKQPGAGKGDAVRTGFQHASGDILVILDADLSVLPEDIPRFIDALISRKGEFINGVRLVYPMEGRSMKFFNMVANKIFGLTFSWLLEQPVKDTLCGTKALWKKDYTMIAQDRKHWGGFDPFGDFDLLLGATRLNLKIVDLPVRYHSRKYGRTNINRWVHGWTLIRITFIAIMRLKLK